MDTPKSKIYITYYKVGSRTHYGEDVVGYALAEDGTCLAQHLSSNITFARHDMGLTSDWKHERYREHYPDGYELEWVDDRESHEGWKAAYAKNQAQRPVREVAQ